MSRNGWLLDDAPLFDTQGTISDVVLYRHPHSFNFKDAWGVGVRKIWATVNINGFRVAYLGVGSGAEVVQALRNRMMPATVFLNDIVAANLDVCSFNVLNTVKQLDIVGLNVKVIPGRAELSLKTVRDRRCKVDRIFGCLPQVPSYNHPNETLIAHMYPVSDYPAIPEWGLGVLFAVLEESRESLSRQGKISLVISGRVPWKVTCELFARTGFKHPKVAGSFLVRHHLETPLTYLQGHTGVRLFRDETGVEEVSAEEAEQQRLAVLNDGKDRSTLNVFHWVFVLEGTPK